MNLFEGTYEEWVGALTVEEVAMIEANFDARGNIRLGDAFGYIPGVAAVSYKDVGIPLTFIDRFLSESV